MIKNKKPTSVPDQATKVLKHLLSSGSFSHMNVVSLVDHILEVWQDENSGLGMVEGLLKTGDHGGEVPVVPVRYPAVHRWRNENLEQKLTLSINDSQKSKPL
jgi:hypothetical protein